MNVNKPNSSTNHSCSLNFTGVELVDTIKLDWSGWEQKGGVGMSSKNLCREIINTMLETQFSTKKYKFIANQTRFPLDIINKLKGKKE